MNAAHRQLEERGHAVVAGLYSAQEIEAIGGTVAQAEGDDPHCRRGTELFAIRRLLHVIPALKPLLFTPALRRLMEACQMSEAFLTKSIYFDKPADSNWFVAWHQDISISVNERRDLPGYSQWTHKAGVTGVVPPMEVLTSTLTVRIHLDDTTEANGALRVVEGSQRQGIIRKEAQPWDPSLEVTCAVPAGGVMLMRPLTMHASRRSTQGGRRRVIHLEFNKLELHAPLLWAERMPID